MSIFASFFKIFSEMVQGLVLSWMGLNKLVIFSFFYTFRICYIYLFVIWIIHHFTSFFEFIFRPAEVDQKEAKTKQIEEQRYVNWQNLRYFIHSMFNIFFLFLAVLQKPATGLRILDFVPHVMCDYKKKWLSDITPVLFWAFTLLNSLVRVNRVLCIVFVVTDI